jgi:hypothetical protein
MNLAGTTTYGIGLSRHMGEQGLANAWRRAV